MTPRQEFMDWAVSRWYAEVANRPLENIHRRSLDDTWRQVIRYCGGDDVALCGMPHDELLDTRIEALEAQIKDNSERYGNKIAARIEALEAALRNILKMDAVASVSMQAVARAALDKDAKQ